MTSSRRSLAHEGGSVSVVVVALAGLVMMLTLLSVDVVLVLGAKGQAQTAADAAALAAAQELLLPSDRSPDEVAGIFATANGAELISCDCEAGSAEAIVITQRTVALPLLGTAPTVRATARAVVAGF